MRKVYKKCNHFFVIEVRLKEYGTELVEVIDNGYGVSSDNFEGLSKFD